MARDAKYQPLQLLSMFRLAADLREQMLAGGFTDNGGAIHSAERILNILGLRLCYPGLSHINNLRLMPDAPFSEQAWLAHQAGEKVLIEHVKPHRALTRLVIAEVVKGSSDQALLRFVRRHYQLALLTVDETARLNKLNRSSITANRLADAGIRLRAVESHSGQQPNAA